MGNSVMGYRGFLRWLAPTPDAGVANYMLTPRSGGQTLEINSKIDPLQLVRDILIDRVLQPSVLQILPEEVGGGDEGVASAEANPRNYLTFIILASLSLVLVILLSILSMVVSCCLFRDHRKSNDDDVEQEVLSKRNDRANNWISLYLAMTILSMVFVFLAIVLTISLIVRAAYIQPFLSAEGGGDHKLRNVVNNALTQIPEFVSESIEEGLISTTETANKLSETVNTLIAKGLETVGDSFFSEISITPYVSSLEASKQAMNRIPSINFNEMLVYNEKLREIARLYSRLRRTTSFADRVRCDQFRDAANAIREFLNVKFSDEISNVIQSFDAALTLSAALDTKLNNDIIPVVQAIEGGLNMKNQLGSLSNVWNTADVEIRQPLNNIMRDLKSPVDELLRIFGPVYLSVIFVIAIIWLIVALLMFACNIYCIVEASKRGLYLKEEDELIMLLNFDSSSSIRSNFSKSDDSEEVLSKAPTKGFPILLSAVSVFLLPTMIFALIFVILVSLLGSEVCRYVNPQDSLPMGNAIADRVVAEQWGPLASSLESSINIPGLVVMPTPVNVLSAVLVGCDPNQDPTTKHTGLLSKVNMTNFIRPHALLYGNAANQTFSDSEQLYIDGITNLNIANNIGNKDQLDTVIDDGIDVLEVITPTPGYNYYEGITNEYTSLGLMFDPRPGSTDIKNQIKAQLNELNGLSAAIDRVVSASTMITPLEAADQLRDAKIMIDNTFTQVQDPAFISGAVSTSYMPAVESMRSDAMHATTESLEQMTQSIIPCSKLYNVSKGVADAICYHTGLFVNIGEYNLLLTIASVNMALAIFFFTFFMRLHGNQCKYLPNATPLMYSNPLNQ